MYTAIGFPSRSDSLLFFPLSLLEPAPSGALPPTGFLTLSSSLPLLEPLILSEGRTVLGKTRTYAQAKALAKVWRATDPLRRTLIVIPTPSPLPLS